MNSDTKSTITLRTDGVFAIHVTDLQKAEGIYSNVMGFKRMHDC